MQTPQILQARSLLLMALLFVVTVTSACAQQKPKRMILGPSDKQLVPESPTQNEDGITQITFGQLFKPGPTEYTRVGAGGLKDSPPLPTGFVLFKELVFRLKTEAIISGYQLTVFSLPSAENETDFNRLNILHLEDDEMSPFGRSWVPVIVLPGGWDERFHQISKAQYDDVLPDFKSKRISALTTQFGLFVIASYEEAKPPRTESLTKMEVVVRSSPEPVLVGREVTHTVTVENKGPNSAGDVNLKYELNTDYDSQSATSSQGVCKRSAGSSGRVLCHLGALPSGEKALVTITARVPTNVLLVKDKTEVGNFLELAFKEKSTDLVEAKNQVFMQFNATILRDQK